MSKSLLRNLRNIIGWFIARFLIITGKLHSAKKKSFHTNTITPVYFHNPNKQLFEKLMKWLVENEYQFISTDQLIEILSNKADCPLGAVWISFDDGWRQNLVNVIPIIEKYRIPITIFIATKAVESGIFWFELVELYAERLPVGVRNKHDLRKLPDTERIKILENIGPVDHKRVIVSLDELKELSNHPLITIGAHTVNHPSLRMCTEERVGWEIGHSKQVLTDWLGSSIKAFAYPNGIFDGRETPFFKQYGYELAASTENSFCNPDTDPYLIPRFTVMDDGSFTENLCHMLGIWEPFIETIKRFLKL